MPKTTPTTSETAHACLAPTEQLVPHQVASLDGLALDLATALADPRSTGLTFGHIDGVLCGYYVEGGTRQICNFLVGPGFAKQMRARQKLCLQHASPYCPQKDWNQSGALIEKFEVQWRKLSEGRWLAWVEKTCSQDAGSPVDACPSMASEAGGSGCMTADAGPRELGAYAPPAIATGTAMEALPQMPQRAQLPPSHRQEGPGQVLAALRCIVACKFGDVVELPVILVAAKLCD